MTWTQQSLERVRRVELGWRRIEDAIARSQARLQTSQQLLERNDLPPLPLQPRTFGDAD